MKPTNINFIEVENIAYYTIMEKVSEEEQITLKNFIWYVSECHNISNILKRFLLRTTI